MKNGCVTIKDTDMYYVSFGSGSKNLVVLPGLSDGLSTVKGKAVFLKAPYKKHLKEYTVTIFSRKNDMPEGSVKKPVVFQAPAREALNAS